MYDTVAEAVPLADRGANRKKAVLVISDGNDTNSETHISEVKQLVRQTEVLVYAIGIDGQGEVTGSYGLPVIRRRPPIQGPFPLPDPAPSDVRGPRRRAAAAGAPGDARMIA